MRENLKGTGRVKGGSERRTKYVHMPYLVSNTSCRLGMEQHACRRVPAEPESKTS